MATKNNPSKRYQNPTFLKGLGEHCRQIRRKKGYSIDRMWREGDKLSPAAVQRLESGNSDVHVSLLYRYASVLGVEPFELLKFQPPKKKT